MTQLSPRRMCLACILLVGSLTSLDSSARAQGTAQQWPGSRQGSATRSPAPTECIKFPQGSNPAQLYQNEARWNLVALMPDQISGTPFRTSQAYPTFAWYKPPTIASYAEFSLLERATGSSASYGDEVLIYSTTFRMQPEAGIVSLTLPNTAGIPPLKVGHQYAWQVELLCGTTQATDDPTFDELEGKLSYIQTPWRSPGVIERVAKQSGLQSRLQAAQTNPAALPALFANADLQWDTVGALLDYYCQAKTGEGEASAAKFQTVWKDFLGSLKLADLATAPITTQCP